MERHYTTNSRQANSQQHTTASTQRYSYFIPLETDESGRAQAAKLTVQFIA